ncbi:tryptophanase [Saccharopolyspora erythraea NRRL 2338]|uniref:Tryptophanase n=1 Tax=Saccharopolyspora erythraea TaxID=1836 RepID=A0ABN1CH71_SACER|nr:tryptophanase [Saccharopolyspora erythraea]EQD82944.1 L-cysteine desulfhydrase [Saccharopolyspora erythraea D]PFG95050.1 tryptophanase [Saccharopolyspora erythraea NRRL 2338]QRK91737.1 tryptophanase [Saccharopolyspora erythraea]
MRELRPYVSAVVRPIPITTREERERELSRAGYNPFNIQADKVSIDFMSDSGTGALSIDQQAWAQRADERYAGAESFYRFRDSVADLVPYPHILPVHQGRAGERILFGALLKSGQISVSNTHFDTTRANVELLGCQALDLPCPQAADLDSDDPFKGDIDLEALERLLTGYAGGRVGQILMTITNNGGGGQPVSMANLRAVSELARRHGVPFMLDAARFAENAWLVTRREEGYENWTPREVARAAFELADGCVASLKKDGLSHVGGFIGLHDTELATRCEAHVIAGEGFRTYGGMTGHTMETLAQGLREVVEPSYLADREREAAFLAEQAHSAGVDTVRPSGLHAIYLNAGRLLPHLRPGDFPGHALGCQLYLEGGIRAVELGSLYLGGLDDDHALVSPAPYELVRLAIPRRVYDHSHLEYVGDVLASIAKEPERVPGYRITHAPELLRHFHLRLEPAARR